MWIAGAKPPPQMFIECTVLEKILGTIMYFRVQDEIMLSGSSHYIHVCTVLGTYQGSKYQAMAG